MANAMYTPYKTALLTSVAPDLSSGAVNVKAILVDTADYTFSASHDFLDDVPSGARVATTGNLTGKSVVAGVFSCSNFSFTAVTGDQSEAIILYVDTGDEATSRLIVFLDTGFTGLPVTPNDGDITVTVNGSGLFAL